MRKLIYYIACSADGFIARQDGGFDYFLTEGPHMADLAEELPETIPQHVRSALGMPRAQNRVFDVVLMGRATFEVGLPHGVTNPYPTLRQLVFSRTMGAAPHPDVELASGDPLARVKELKSEIGRDIWLCGGSALAATLAPAIDELILKVHPVIIGAGIPLFAGPVPTTRLTLIGTKHYANGFVRQHYRAQSEHPT
jgi:dihydrofolate reductase